MSKNEARTSKKRLRTQDTSSYKKTKILQEETVLETLIQTLVQEQKKPSKSQKIWLCLDATFNNEIQFRHTLENYDAHLNPPVDQVEILTREYEESFMRECFFIGDRPCSMGANCECNFIDNDNPFVGVCFVNPVIKATDLSMCILCIRKQVQMLYYKVVSGALKTDKLIQTCGNICNQPGEYHSSAMLVIPPYGPLHCMPLPMVAHQRNHYYVEKKDGIIHLKQKNVYFEDF